MRPQTTLGYAVQLEVIFVAAGDILLYLVIAGGFVPHARRWWMTSAREREHVSTESRRQWRALYHGFRGGWGGGGT